MTAGERMDFSVEQLPHVNATLNAVSGVLLSSGYVAIRRGNKRLHARLMGAAFLVSVLFLISYLTYHYSAGHNPYPGEGLVRGIYLVILLTHIVLAIAVVPLALVTVILALRGRFKTHRKIARWTFPIWLYVSVTGVVVYVMLYHYAGVGGES